MLFKGCATALVTPFNKDFSVNRKKFAELVERQIAGGVKALVINGTTGEASTMTKEELRGGVKLAIEVANKRIPIIAGTGSNDTAKALEETKAAEEMGADAAMLVTPYYNKTSQSGLIAHYACVADNTNIPILLYNVPSRTGMNINVETMVELAKHPRIVGIKDATGNPGYALDILRQVKKKDFALYSGNDDVVVPYLSIGAAGVISTVGNLLPTPMREICDAAAKNDWETARKIQAELLPVINAVFGEVNPIGTKGGMNLLDMEVGLPRLPLVDMADGAKKKLKAALDAYMK